MEIHKKYAKEGLVVITVSLDPLEDPSSQANALRFLKKTGAEASTSIWRNRLKFGRRN